MRGIALQFAGATGVRIIRYSTSVDDDAATAVCCPDCERALEDCVCRVRKERRRC